MIGKAVIAFDCVANCNSKEIYYGKCKHLKSGQCSIGLFFSSEELNDFLQEAKANYIQKHFLEKSGLFAEQSEQNAVTPAQRKMLEISQEMKFLNKIEEAQIIDSAGEKLCAHYHSDKDCKYFERICEKSILCKHSNMIEADIYCERNKESEA